MNYFNKCSRTIKMHFNKKKIMINNFTLITNNCLGGFVYHDFGMRFNSPFINLWIEPKDFIKFLKNMDYYLEMKPVFLKYNNLGYPVMQLGDILIYCQHYQSEEDALAKWNQRKKRINKNYIYIIMSERDGCTLQNMKDFDNLPFKNKVIFTHKEYVNIKSSFPLLDYKNQKEVGLCFQYKSKFFGKRYYDEFPMVDWINGNTIYNK